MRLIRDRIARIMPSSRIAGGENGDGQYPYGQRTKPLATMPDVTFGPPVTPGEYDPAPSQTLAQKFPKTCCGPGDRPHDPVTWWVSCDPETWPCWFCGRP